jgi:hypothetical protein
VNYVLNSEEEEEKCELCNNKGLIYIWRSDLEDFGIAICPKCRKKEK